MTTCPCGKLIDVGPVCPSCAPAYRAGEVAGAHNVWLMLADDIEVLTGAIRIALERGKRLDPDLFADAIRKEAGP